MQQMNGVAMLVIIYVKSKPSIYFKSLKKIKTLNLFQKLKDEKNDSSTSVEALIQIYQGRNTKLKQFTHKCIQDLNVFIKIKNAANE